MASDSDSSAQPPTRRTFVKLALGLGGAAVAAGLVGPLLAARLFSSENTSEGGVGDGTGGGTGGGIGGGSEGGSEGEDMTQPVSPCDELAPFRGNIRSGGPPKDGIPPIDNPRFTTAAGGDAFLQPTDIVFGLDRDGVQRAYPQRILVWHEIVNDRVAGQRLSVTYCPLTGSQIAFVPPTAGDGETFGTSGSLVNSNLLMYDRASDSNWPQILGTAINGDRCASALAEVPLVWTTWEQWRQRHPDTEVLTTETGFIRDYSSDPYGRYTPSLGGYYASDRVLFRVMNSSDRFHPKKVVFGVKAGGQQLAIPAEEFHDVRVKNITLGGTTLVALQDGDLDAVRVFRREVEGNPLDFQHVGGRIVDEGTGTVWSPEGIGLEGSLQGTSLDPVSATNVMWFAWYAFYPETEVLS